MKNFSKYVVTLLLVLSSSGLFSAELKKTDSVVSAPNLSLENLKGEMISLKDFEGKVVLVQFWATYCTPCRVEMPSMNNLEKSLKEQNIPFKILAINMGETKQEVQKFVDEVKPKFTILMDTKGENVQAWNVFAAPSNFLIDKRGYIRYTLYGGVEWDSDEISNTIKTLASEE